MQGNLVGQLLKESNKEGVNTLKLRDVATWVEEHTNLCTTLAMLAGSDPEFKKKMNSSLRKSMERGKSIMSSLVSVDDAVGSESLTVDAGRRRPAAIPLSGFQRFEEAASFCSPRNTLIRPGVMANQLSSTSAPMPSPSRTYVKKTVS